ncbi:hypothetical protein KABACHOK_04710 [Brevundimonas phage vB_BpoS-Kabachok]|uniref:Uncharacterized protein n=1 Tax=Brevundimonas phage vB_BpoS-Kabachok TaxID=2948600 RepID=A0A9E7MQM1_9CAUD|nr:hypothetical protein KABACHOK_04710 [Brevundimonas phage vB_BpoS-Kabachok]
MSADKTLGEIAAERDERALYLSDPELYDALVRTEPGTIHLTADMASPLTLRTTLERLGYEVTPEMSDILLENPTGPWTLDDLKTLFVQGDDKTAADCRARFPHEVRFAEWVGPPGAQIEVLPTPPADWRGFPLYTGDDGDEDTRL